MSEWKYMRRSKIVMSNALAIEPPSCTDNAMNELTFGLSAGATLPSIVTNNGTRNMLCPIPLSTR